ncbi:MAG TPA: hypothetical protein VG145_09110, partial [Xanthobacteraceae bacterium]|nr:hypothetical protein [Xanthobacteraceae bacterium]
MPTALTQPRQFGWQATQLNFIGNLRSSRVTPAWAEPPSVVSAPGNAKHKAAALINTQPRMSGDFNSLKPVPS